jgi:E3 ubiquitin-protein ligase LRSAM1
LRHLHRYLKYSHDFVFQVHLEQSDLRKKDVLSAMSDLLEQELNLIQTYQDGRSDASKVMLESENSANLLLNDVFDKYDKSRSEIIDKVNQDEDWQKSAVAALIAKNDARSWGLMEQIKIVESQIAAMTNFEIDKKKVNQEEFLNDVADKRVNLTMVLLDLMEQQDKRKQQLRDTLLDMENQKTEDDFWLIQYQKLLDSRGVMQSMQASLDPALGYNLLLNGVIHVVPFLLKIWQKKDFQLERVTDEDLKVAGIKNPKDREGVLKSINDFLAGGGNAPAPTKTLDSPGPSKPPSAPQESFKSSSSASSPQREHAAADAVNAVECVVCMDAQTRVIFLPCGELDQKIPRIPTDILPLSRSLVLLHRMLNGSGRLPDVSSRDRSQDPRHSTLKHSLLPQGTFESSIYLTRFLLALRQFPMACAAFIVVFISHVLFLS